jgi:hypothetical protein
MIVEPLRYFFSQFPKTEDGLFWDPDEKKSKIEIGTVNDFHKIPLQTKPRILVSRGNYSVNKSGLSDNMASAPGIKDVFGKSERTNLVFVNGVAQIIIETSQEGTCELITDMVTHFLAATRPFLCNEMGFHEFGLDMSVSACEPDKEDTEKFKVSISIPYRCEDSWMVKFDAVTFKSLYVSIKTDNIPERLIARIGQSKVS